MNNSLVSWTYIAFLIAGNTLPILGIFFLGWSGFLVLFIYWLEMAIVGGFTLLKIVLALPGYQPVPGRFVTYQQKAGDASRSFVVAEIAKVWVVLGFVLAYAAAMTFFVILVACFVYPRYFTPEGITRMVQELAYNRGIWIATLVLLFFDHAMEFYRDFFGGPEWARADPLFQMYRPFGFLVMLYFLWLVGGFVASFGGATGALVLFVVFKTVGELASFPFTTAEPWRRIASGSA